MPVTTAIAVFFLIWWVVLFAVLPWGVRSQHEGGEVFPAPTRAPRRIPVSAESLFGRRSYRR